MTENLNSPIVGYGSPVLRVFCDEAEPGDDTTKVILTLQDTIANLQSCVGLAAPQINSNKRIFVLRPNVHQHYVMINPVITKRRNKQHYEEGCMSIPGVFGRVDNRDDIIDVECYNEFFELQKYRLRGFESIIFQHEYDHLNGILFIDHLTKVGREEIQHKLNEIEKGRTSTLYRMVWPNTQILHQNQINLNG